jgi:hypothetical protein
MIHVMEELNVSLIATDHAYKWFTSKEGGFELCLHSLANQAISEIGDEIASLI